MDPSLYKYPLTVGHDSVTLGMHTVAGVKMHHDSAVAQKPRAEAIFAVLGAHGGAGTSTVSHWLNPDGSTSTMELHQGSQLPPHYTPVVVARSTAFGMLRASQLIGRWHPDVPRPFLVVVRDAPLRIPKPAAYRRQAVQGRVLDIVNVPYLVGLRDADNPAQGLTFRAVQRAASDLRRALGLAD